MPSHTLFKPKGIRLSFSIWGVLVTLVTQRAASPVQGVCMRAAPPPCPSWVGGWDDGKGRRSLSHPRPSVWTPIDRREQLYDASGGGAVNISTRLSFQVLLYHSPRSWFCSAAAGAAGSPRAGCLLPSFKYFSIILPVVRSTSLLSARAASPLPLDSLISSIASATAIEGGMGSYCPKKSRASIRNRW